MSKSSIKLNDGHLVPPIAYGSGTAWFQATGPDGISPELSEATQTALRVGYTHLDAAKVYANERSTGSAIVASGVKRDEMFLTTKVCSLIRTSCSAYKVSEVGIRSVLVF